MNIIFLCLLLCAAPPAKQEEDRPFQLNMSYNISKDAKIYLELPVPEVEQKVKVLTREQFRKHAKKIMAIYVLSGVFIRDGEVTVLYFHLRVPEEPQEEKRSDISTKP